MKNFFIIVNRSKKDIEAFSNSVKEYIESKGGVSVLDTPHECDIHVRKDAVPRNTECIIVLGGDGTILQAASDLSDLGLPFLGINLGNLGFLAAAEKHDMTNAIDQMMLDKYITEERMLVVGTAVKNGKRLESIKALNEVVVTGKSPMQLIDISVWVNKQLLHKYRADGLIVATPTGSTGYSMSAGGPIMDPTGKNIILTPICQHSLHNRSIVLSDEDEICIKVDPDRYDMEQQVELFFDGKNSISLSSNDEVNVKRAPEVIKIIKLHKESFLETLHKKLQE